MGFRREKVLKLVFTDPEWDGLEVRCKPPSIEAMAYAAEMQGQRIVPADFKVLIGHFAEGLLSWNYEAEDGTPYPASFEQLCKLDQEFVSAIIDAWMDALIGVERPLEEPSNDGEQSLVASLPMAPLSESQAS